MTNPLPSLRTGASLVMAASTGHASGCLDTAQQKATVVEMVTFKLLKGITDTEFLQATEAMETGFLCAYKGFVRRTLSKSDEDSWLDHIEWTDMKAAKNVFELALQVPATGPFFQAVDPNSVTLKYLTITRQTG